MKLAPERKIKRIFNPGSALILAIVLTSILAIIGAMFLMTSRVNRMSASAMQQNKTLNAAVESLVSQLSQQLIFDTPGVFGHEYYDYPDVNNLWLANLEPNESYLWRQISDVTGFLGNNGYLINHLRAVIIEDHNRIVLNLAGGLADQPADADGDGVADAKWIQLGDVTSTIGKPVYAAVRVIDNGAMLNLNTASRFDPNSTIRSFVDGSSQMRINLTGLTWHPFDPCDDYEPIIEEADLKLKRDPNGSDNYENDVIWHYEEPDGVYTPFDMADELELRYRFLLNNEDIDARVEDWGGEFRKNTEEVPFTPGDNLSEWLKGASAYNNPDPNYSYRHIATTYNMDRIINPQGLALNNARMINVNAINNIADVNVLYQAIDAGFIDANVINPQLAAQLAVNLKDITDNDSQVTEFIGPNSITYYGYEKPCIFISELVHVFDRPDPCDANNIRQSYAIELCKYHKHLRGTNSDGWSLFIDGENLGTGAFVDNIDDYAIDGRKYRVIVFPDPNGLSLTADVTFTDTPEDGEEGIDPRALLDWPQYWADDGSFKYDVYFGVNENDVESSTKTNVLGDTIVEPNYLINSYDPVDPITLNPNLQLGINYHWRIDNLNNSNVIQQKGDVKEFTTWTAEPNYVLAPPLGLGKNVFKANSNIELRRVIDVNTTILIDQVSVPGWLIDTNDPNNENIRQSYQRDMTPPRFIKRLWAPNTNEPNLGHSNSFTDPLSAPIQVYFGDFNNIVFNNVGEIGKVFRTYMYADSIPLNSFGLTENDVRLNLADAVFQPLFRYFTRFDPAGDGIDNDGDGNTVNENIITQTPEWKIPGRININTAPWYVIAQLPWVSQKWGQPFDPSLARAIVGYREKFDLSPQGPDFSIWPLRPPGFASIGELNNVIHGNPNWSMDYYIDANDQLTFPDLTPGDGALYDFEERDLIFARISDLVTVRSDVFTAFILVRIGTDGPQKRAVAILDRSDVYPHPTNTTVGKVKIRALYFVPDPR